MNFQFYLEKLLNSREFLKFKKENPSAFLCSAFFSIDNTENGKDNQQHLDYFIPELKKIFSVKLNKNPLEIISSENATLEGNEYFPKPLPDNLNFEFNDMENIIRKKMLEEKINKKIEKLLWSIQQKNNKTFLIGTIFISNLGMIKTTIDLDEKAIIEFEKKSFFDFIKVVKKKDK